MRENSKKNVLTVQGEILRKPGEPPINELVYKECTNKATMESQLREDKRTRKRQNEFHLDDTDEILPIRKRKFKDKTKNGRNKGEVSIDGFSKVHVKLNK
jgi:hypothetical protein